MKAKTVHLGRIFEACYEKGSELPESDPRRKFKGRTVFQGNSVHDENSDHALFSKLGPSPASMGAAKPPDAPGSQPDSPRHRQTIQAYIQAVFTGVPHGYHFPEIGGPKIGKRSIGMVILIVGEFGNNISMAMWSSQDGNKFYLTFGIQFSSSRTQLPVGCVR